MNNRKKVKWGIILVLVAIWCMIAGTDCYRCVQNKNPKFAKSVRSGRTEVETFLGIGYTIYAGYSDWGATENDYFTEFYFWGQEALGLYPSIDSIWEKEGNSSALI